MRKVTFTLVLGICTALSSAAIAECPHPGEMPNVVILGIDGMDPELLQRFIDKGRMPNFERMMHDGAYSPLETSAPPQSPVAWSNFITGMDPGGHGIFDFIHRDPATYMPTFSTALVSEAEKTIRLGDWVIPLSAGKVELLRKGEAFWQRLDHCKVPYVIFRIPANFPPVESEGTNVSGMGTPDILGSYGTFSFYTDDPAFDSLEPSGGAVYPVRVKSGRVTAKLLGPENTFKADKPVLEREFTVDLDRDNRAALLTVGDRKVILQEGEFSDWVQVEFNVLGPFNKITGITRFFLKQVRPRFQLYATPINIDPSNPALPVSNPSGFAKALYDKIGYYYTQGMPEDTKALEWGILTDAEFVQQTEVVFQERLRMLDAVIDDYDGGLLFFYFSSVDQTCHMLWRNMDPSHPGHDPATAKYGDRIEDLYTRLDSVLGVVQERIPEDATLIIMSDHGFAPYYKKVNLNTWLYENGYITLRKAGEVGQHPLFRNVYWRRTKAYALGINGLYVNLLGREGQGVVRRGDEYEQLVEEITQKLLGYRDPETGEAVVRRVYRADEIYHGESRDLAPDIIVGYTRGYRGSDDCALGSLSKTVITPNLDKWSGDHCMAFEDVPGILLANRPITVGDPNLTDLAATILQLYGMEPTEQMVGRPLFDPSTVSAR